MANQQVLPRQEERVPMDYITFLNTISESRQAEWVDGEAILFMPPDKVHQQIVRFLFLLLGTYVEAYQLGEVLPAPFEMKILPEGNSREPDILFVGREHLSRLTDKRLVGAADLAIEVVSPESSTRDYTEKFQEYQNYGVQEYWIVDPRAGYKQAYFWVLDEAGQYQPISTGPDGIVHSTVISGFWLDPNWLWSERPPTSLQAFAEITGSNIDLPNLPSHEDES